MRYLIPGGVVALPLIALQARAVWYAAGIVRATQPVPMGAQLVRLCVGERCSRVLDLVASPGHVRWRAGRAVAPVGRYRARLDRARSYSPLHGQVSR